MGSSIKRILPFLLLCLGCRHKDRSCSFYYWKTAFAPDSLEKQAMAYNHVQELYIRYFDVDFPPADSLPRPVAPITFHDSVTQQVIPVIFIRNRVFERSDSTAIHVLAGNIFHLVSAVSAAQRLHTPRIQFDCDWTERTAPRYFYFLQAYQAISGQQVGCTIRLHQVKYPTRTGIPPVDHGVLMYYNMGDIDAGSGNSIYEPAIAARYIPSLRTYPIQLDVALPIFSWGLRVRNGHVTELLNKMNFLHFRDDTNFIRIDNGRYQAKTACFSNGYYFREKDVVKIEHISTDELANIAEDIRRHSNHHLGNIIFFDLDRTNLILYDKDDLLKILAHFD